MPDWSIGEVLADPTDGKARVFFVEAGEKVIRLDLVSLNRVEGAAAKHPILDNLKLGSPNTGALRNKVVYRSFRECVTKFLHLFPEGFLDKEYLGTERTYKVEAHNMMKELLGEKALEPFLCAVQRGFCRFQANG